LLSRFAVKVGLGNDDYKNGHKESNRRKYAVLVELSPLTYLTLCGLVSDALHQPSDATPLLVLASKELGTATAGGMIPSELVEQPEHMENLRRAGFAGR
jgi:hypothetical protein